jgi:hypothetical protein
LLHIINGRGGLGFWLPAFRLSAFGFRKSDGGLPGAVIFAGPGLRRYFVDFQPFGKKRM